jgi:hypothetical protein
MALRTRKVPYGLLKNEFADVDETVLQGVEGRCELILFIPDIEIKKLDGRLSDF